MTCCCEIGKNPAEKIVTEVCVASNESFAPGMHALRVVAPDLCEKVCPGQFVEIDLLQPDLVLPRPFSVFRAKCDGDGYELEIRYQVLGKGTRRLAEMEPGARLRLIGPLGNRWPVDEAARRVLMIGGGIGSAPLAMLAEELADAGCGITMVQGAQTRSRMVAAEVFADLCDCHVLASDDGSCGYHGFVTEPLIKLLDDNGYDVAYICGPEPMQEACAQLCLDAGLPTWVSLERLMACGVGACLSCVVPTTEGLKRVCADGPIFNAKEVIWGDAKPSRVH